MLLGNACTVGTIFISFCRQHVTATDLHMLVPGCAGTRTSCMTAPSSRRACITRSSTSPGQALQDCITRSSTSPGQAHHGPGFKAQHPVKHIWSSTSSQGQAHQDFMKIVFPGAPRKTVSLPHNPSGCHALRKLPFGLPYGCSMLQYTAV